MKSALSLLLNIFWVFGTRPKIQTIDTLISDQLTDVDGLLGMVCDRIYTNHNLIAALGQRAMADDSLGEFDDFYLLGKEMELILHHLKSIRKLIIVREFVIEPKAKQAIYLDIQSSMDLALGAVVVLQGANHLKHTNKKPTEVGILLTDIDSILTHTHQIIKTNRTKKQ